MRRVAAGAALCAAVAGFAAVQAPAAQPFVPLTPTLAADYAPVESGAEGGLWMASREAEETVAASPRRVGDAALETYVHEVVCRLSRDYCDRVRVYLVRVPYFNASMMPNGAMQVWSGLLLRVHDEAQLAAVLGHELGHFLRRHSLDGFNDMKTKANLLTLFTLGLGGAVAAGGVAPVIADGASAGAQLATLGSIYAFSRSHEREADHFGIQLLADAGYDPAQAAAVWRNLIDEERAGGDDKKSRGFFFTTHPSPERRLETLDEQAAMLAGRQQVAGEEARSRYYAAVGAHLAGFFDDELRLNQPGRSAHLFERLRAVGFAPGLVHYYLGEVERLRDTSRLSDAALSAYEAALAHPDAPVEAHRAVGLWKLKAKDLPAARAAFEQYLAGAPQAPDREMIEYYLGLTGGSP